MPARPDAPTTFTHEALHDILTWLRAELLRHGEATLHVPDPDDGHALGLYPGEPGPRGTHRPLLTWTDTADLLDAHLHTPVPVPEGLRLHFRSRVTPPRDRSASRYGADSDFQRADKLQDPHLLHDLHEAWTRANLPPDARVLSLGVNSARELDVLHLAYPGQALHVTGVDLDESALRLARDRHPQHTFRTLDVTGRDLAALGTFDAVTALSVLQSPGIVQEDLLRTLRTTVLRPGGTLILGYPNARYRGGELSYGARMLNFTRPDLSLLMRDVTAARRHLQKHGFTVYVTGKYEVLVTAVRHAT